MEASLKRRAAEEEAKKLENKKYGFRDSTAEFEEEIN